MSRTRTATPAMMKTLALFAAAVLAGGPQAGLADMQTSSDVNATLGGLSLGATTEAAKTEASAGNIGVLQAKITELTNRAAASTAAEATQLRAVASALQGMVSRLQAGSTITAYNVTSDESTLETVIAMSFADANGNVTVVKTVIPPTQSYTGDDTTTDTGSGTNTETSSGDTSTGDSGSSGGSDMLTQLLQQLGSQMGGGQNPLGNIQGALNNLVNNNGASSPVEMISDAVKQAVSGALQCTTGGAKAAGNGVAVYDIEAKKVYMPDGSVLEAHSGLDGMMDNPAYVNQKGRGPTPPGVYSLSMRESLFHGTQAIRMTPASGTQMYGRTGILAHPPLRRGTVGSAGCIAFRDYNKFLNAFKRGEVKQVVVVSSAADANKACTKPSPDYTTPNPTGGASS